MPEILLVDDNQELLEILQRALLRQGCRVSLATDGQSAFSQIEGNFFNVVVTDLRMPRLDGLELLKKVRQISPETAVIMMTAFGSVENAVEAMRQGAFDYLLKPFSSEELKLRVNKVLEQQNLKLENVLLKETMRFGSMLGRSPPMLKVFELVEKAAPTDAPVLVLGQSGTGKELVARDIHNLSRQSRGPFVPVNCVALASTILESELFGHEKGSFTGAVARQLGKFEMADGGTLFLDEIGEMEESAQVKLLRFLQEKTFERVGGNQTIRVDARVIAATNRELEPMLADKTFREDLYYRLNVFTIQLPPLKDRGDDINELVRYFLERYNKELHKTIAIQPEVMALFKNYSWPGNVRELENVIARAVILSDGPYLDPGHIPLDKPGMVPLPQIKPTAEGMTGQLEGIEREIIRQALSDNKWNQVKTARQLKIKRTSLQYKLKKYGLAPMEHIRRRAGKI